MKNETHNFDIDIAKKYNLNVAVVYYTIMLWINYKNKIKKGKHKAKNGKSYYFAYASSSSLQEQMPYLSKASIKNALKKLSDDGFLVVGVFNKFKWDKTYWYADKKREIIDKKEETIDKEKEITDGLILPIGNKIVSNNTISFDCSFLKKEKIYKKEKFSENENSQEISSTLNNECKNNTSEVPRFEEANHKSATECKNTSSEVPRFEEANRKDSTECKDTSSEVPHLKKKKLSKQEKNKLIDEEFENKFYKFYPLKRGKAKAREVFRKMSKKKREMVCKAVHDFVKSDQVQRNIANGTKQYIPMCSTWINQGRWEDEDVANIYETEKEKLIRQVRELAFREINNVAIDNDQIPFHASAIVYKATGKPLSTEAFFRICPELKGQIV